LVFKGGTALKRCYFGDYRFSEDLDFTLADDLPVDSIPDGLERIFADVRTASGIRLTYSRDDRKQHLNSYTFYLAYEGPLPGAAPREVKVDITIREELVCSLQERPVLRGYREYEDLPEGRTIRVYGLDEIAVEKIVALTDRARNEPRDLFDVWFLTGEGHVDLAMLTPEIEKKLEFRDRAMEGMREEFKRKEARYRKLWATRLGSQMAELPPFNDVFRSVLRSMRSAGLMGR